MESYYSPVFNYIMDFFSYLSNISLFFLNKSNKTLKIFLGNRSGAFQSYSIFESQRGWLECKLYGYDVG